MAQDELDQVEDLVEWPLLDFFAKTPPNSRESGIPFVQGRMVKITMLRLQNLVPATRNPRPAVQYIQTPRCFGATNVNKEQVPDVRSCFPRKFFQFQRTRNTLVSLRL